MLRIANNINELLTYSAKIVETSDFKLDRINFNEQDHWKVKKGKLSHKSGGYFHIVGLKNHKDQKENLFIFQPQSALTGLLIHKKGNEIFVLIQARIEPGNIGVLQFGPTIQSTPANYMQVHGGNKATYLDMFYATDDNVIGFDSTNHLDLGERYYQKTKWCNYAVIDKFVETDESYIWASLSVLRQALKIDYIINTDLRSLLALYDWDSFFETQKRQEANISKLFQYYLKKKSCINGKDTFFDIKNSDSVCVTENSIYLKENKNTEIVIYSVKTKHREVGEWIQPLWKAKEKGLIVLFCKDFDDFNKTKFLVSVEEENGVSGKYNITTSYFKYPDNKIDEEILEIGQTIGEINQSDEGGRFIDHEYLFRISEVEDNFQIAENQFWVSISELKKILSTSNLPSVHLRNVCSILLEKLNPITFKT